MSDLLALGSSAISVYKQALATVSNNIANVNSDGYSRQTLAINQNQPVQTGSTFLGTGARVAAIERQFDGFVERQLRVSTSDLAAQKPLVEYAGRILDRFASQDSALSGSLDRFFSSLGALGADASSLALREVALSDSALLADRFQALDQFLDDQGDASQTALKATVAEINALATELGGVNQKLGRKDALAKQAPALLDERDRLLRSLSEKVRLDVTEARSGVVTVSLGGGAGAGALVAGNDVRALGVQFDPLAEDRMAFFLEPTTPAQGRRVLAGVGGGTLGGLVTFREQVLEPTRSTLDTLARGLVAALNEIHGAGMGLDGQTGRALFALKPDYQLVGLDAERGFSLETALAATETTLVENFELRFDPASDRWSAFLPPNGLEPAQTIIADDDGLLRFGGIALRVVGATNGAETLRVQGAEGGAGDMVLSLLRAEHLAAADPLRLRAGELNGEGARGRVSFSSPTQLPLGPRPLGQLFDNNPSAAAGKAVAAGGVIASIPAGSTGVELLLSGARDAGTDLRLMTREGVLLSGPGLTEVEQGALLNPEQGFEARASYRALGDGERYRDLTVRKGVFSQTRSDGREQLSADRALLVNAGGGLATDVLTALEGGAVAINGQTLSGAISSNGDGAVSAREIAAWMNGQAGFSDAGITAQAQTRLVFSTLNFSDHAGLTLNGEAVVAASGGTPVVNLAGLVDEINGVTARTGVIARAGLAGELVLMNAEGREGESIRIGAQAPLASDDNILGAANGSYAGTLTLTGPAAFSMTLEGAGSPGVLSALGMDTRLRLEGDQRDDLLVMLSGAETVSLAAGYGEGRFDALASLREEALEVRFEDGGARYVVSEISTGTMLAQGRYVPGAAIRYGGAILSFEGQPSAGDRFVLEDNRSGVDDNRNSQRLAALAEGAIRDLGDKSASDYYASLASRVGTLSRQAVIGEQALEVVKAQAEEARDRVSGVSLDEEAADLIRYQQAYQAAAKIIQTSQDLFDAVLAI